ncbi:MAG: M48 family metalloprotease, partial [Rhodothermaceae bacterium]|nr:M48 family metalloprotease [Rhodothermaceae bacterium]
MNAGVKTVLLLGTLSGLVLALDGSLGGEAGLLLAFVIAIAMNFGSYWFSDKIVLRMYRAQEVGESHQLYRLTERLAQNAGLPMPRVYIIPGNSPNAFATGRNPENAAVAATEGLIRNLSKEELAGVMAHELAHVRNRDILISSIAATLAATIMV